MRLCLIGRIPFFFFFFLSLLPCHGNVLCRARTEQTQTKRPLFSPPSAIPIQGTVLTVENGTARNVIHHDCLGILLLEAEGLTFF